MPTYEYGCPKCGHEFEAEQRITEAPLKSCPKCKSRRVKRLISRTSFVLKGGGWYSDLYSSGGAEKSGDAGEGGASDSKADAKSESGKSETKSESSSEASKPSGDGGKSKSKGKAKSESKAKAA
jgi:putative FmdB family regulatory protein